MRHLDPVVNRLMDRVDALEQLTTRMWPWVEKPKEWKFCTVHEAAGNHHFHVPLVCVYVMVRELQP